MNRKRNCPFYGRAMFTSPAAQRPLVLLNTHGNQCALVITSHSPCRLETQGKAVEWEECPLVREARVDNA